MYCGVGGDTWTVEHTQEVDPSVYLRLLLRGYYRAIGFTGVDSNGKEPIGDNKVFLTWED